MTTLPKDQEFKSRVCKNSCQTSNDLNEHWELELFCKTCEEFIEVFYEGQSENCLPDDEEHITHEWTKISINAPNVLRYQKFYESLKPYEKEA